MRRTVERRGFVPIAVGKRRQNYLTAEDAEALRAAIADERSYRISPQISEVPSGTSGVYAVAAPSYDGTVRVKIGWSERMAERFATYRTLIPDLQVLAIWPTGEQWAERAALLCASQNGRRVGEELFEFADTPAALEVLGALFASMGISRIETLPGEASDHA